MSSPVNSTSPYPSVTAADINAHTIQALVELIYAKTANDVLTSALAGLQEALATTQNVLSTLTGLQNLKNNVKPIAKSGFDFDYAGTDEDDYEEDYNEAASAYFGTPIDPGFFIGNTKITSNDSPGFTEFRDQMNDYRSALETQIKFLSGISDITSKNNLYAKLKVVYNDLPVDANNYSAVSKWVIDNYDVHGSDGVAIAGNLQQHLTDAITAGQSLNSSQQTSVQNYLFIFQQYYQSAAAVLTALNQIITKMAENAGR